MWDPEIELRLHDRTVAEPVVRGWYAWPHLISPATAALNLVLTGPETKTSFGIYL